MHSPTHGRPTRSANECASWNDAEGPRGFFARCRHSFKRHIVVDPNFEMKGVCTLVRIKARINTVPLRMHLLADLLLVLAPAHVGCIH